MKPVSISVIIPAHNAEAYLAAAISSVREQSLPAAEIIVVDDGSSDATAAIAKDNGNVTYLRQDQSGAAAARNLGAAKASGEWIAFLDADDLWVPEKLRIQNQALRDNESIDLFFGYIQEFVSETLPSEEAAKLRPRKDPLTGPSNITLLMRRNAFMNTGGFPTDLKLGEFIAWYDQVTHSGFTPLMLPQVLAHRRLHTTNQGRTNRKHLSNFALIAKRALDRKRLA